MNEHCVFYFIMLWAGFIGLVYGPGPCLGPIQSGLFQYVKGLLGF